MAMMPPSTTGPAITTGRRRVQVDLTEGECQQMESWANFVGAATKKEVISNALTLLHWASHEMLHGRKVCSVDAAGGVKELTMPCLQKFYQAGMELDARSPSIEELMRRANARGIPAEQALERLYDQMATSREEPTQEDSK